MNARCLLTLAASLILFPGETHAKRPDLDAVFWGNLAHNGNEALRPSFLGEITVSAWRNGVKLAELAVPPSAAPNPSHYILKVPVDDGADPRLPATTRAGERIVVKIRNVTLNQEVECNQTAGTAGLPIPTAKGAITVLNLSTDESLGGASPMMARYAAWKAERNFQVNVLDNNADTDGDGMSNFAEFLANTDPQSSSDTLRIINLLHKNAVTSIQTGPVKSGRRYTIWCSRTMAAGDWQKAGEFSVSADADAQWFDHSSGAAGQLFYRVEVSIQ